MISDMIWTICLASFFLFLGGLCSSVYLAQVFSEKPQRRVYSESSDRKLMRSERCEALGASDSDMFLNSWFGLDEANFSSEIRAVVRSVLHIVQTVK